MKAGKIIKKASIIAAVVFTLLWVLPGCKCPLVNSKNKENMKSPAEKIICGNFFTADRNLPRAAAVAIAGGIILPGLGEDITLCDPEHIRDTPVLGTLVGGKWVYRCE